MKSQWRLAEPESETVRKISSLFALDPRLARIIASRGLTEPVEVFRYLAPRLSTLSSPFLMTGMEQAVTRIRAAVERDEKIGIFADSDVDGLTSLAVMLRLLERIGLKNTPWVRYPVEDEDYGLTLSIVDEFVSREVTLLITLDAGMRDVEEIRRARSSGLDVIVCDHHEQGAELPEAIVVNPKQKACAHPFKGLAGVAVAFKLCYGLLYSYLQRFNKLYVIITEDAGGVYLSRVKNRIVLGTEQFSALDDLKNAPVNEDDTIIVYRAPAVKARAGDLFPRCAVHDLEDLVLALRSDGQGGRNDRAGVFGETAAGIFSRQCDLAVEVFLEYDYQISPRLVEFMVSAIDLVALGTIADIVPLVGENRTIMHHGLKSLRSTTHPGLKALMGANGFESSSKSLAWGIAPLLNTPGRFGKAALTASFFLESDERTMKLKVAELNALNKERKEILAEFYARISGEIAEGRHRAGDSSVFVTDKSVPDGLCGLLANRLSESLNKPVIVIASAPGKEVVKGSGRARGNFNFFSCVEPFSHLFDRIGGHAQAFGFSARAERLGEIRDAVARSVDGAAGLDREPSCHIDAEITLQDITLDFIDRLSVLEPFGHKNEEPLFLARMARVREFARFGSGKNHGKYLLSDNHSLEAVGWGMADLMERRSSGDCVDIVFRLERHEFNGRTLARMVIVDID